MDAFAYLDDYNPQIRLSTKWKIGTDVADLEEFNGLHNLAETARFAHNETRFELDSFACGLPPGSMTDICR